VIGVPIAMLTIQNAVNTFFSRYKNTLTLLDRFLADGKNHQEFVLLSCARLDSLANLAFPDGTQKARFSRFLAKHSGLGKQTFAVSVPDLFYYFQHYLWIRGGNIPHAGRIMLYRERDKEFAQFIYDSGIPVTGAHVGSLLKNVMDALKIAYRISPAQRVTKRTSAPLRDVVGLISDAVKKYASRYPDSEVHVVGSIVNSYTLGALLYRRYRSTAIHEWGVELEESEFFTRTEVYWQTAPVHSHRFLKVQFPARLLLNMLKRSIDSYKRELVAIRKLPFGLWVESGLDEEYLDTRSVLGEVPVRLVVR
jgi:hypothetical protein